jgi:hypothetical protein
MTILRSPLQHPLHRRPIHHPLTPRLDCRPIFNIYTKEFEHPGHRKREVRDVSDGGTVWERDVILSWEGEASFQYIPLLENVCVESRRLARHLRLFKETTYFSTAFMGGSGFSRVGNPLRKYSQYFAVAL